MTVIAYRDGILATDSGVWQGDMFAGYTNKIYRLADGRLFAACGRRCDVIDCVKWLNGEGDRPKEDPEKLFGGFIVGPMPHNVLKIEYDFRPYEPASATFYLDGAHPDFLRGALAAGASAAEAVELAIKYGDSAAGEVQAEKV